MRQTFGAERYLIERIADYGEILAARFGDDEPLALATKELEPELGFERFTCWLTAPGVTNSSSAARVKLLLRAAASKALTALSEGRRRGIRLFYQKSSGPGEPQFTTARADLRHFDRFSEPSPKNDRLRLALPRG